MDLMSMNMKGSPIQQNFPESLNNYCLSRIVSTKGVVSVAMFW